jgi:hypothetical protein
VKLHYLIDGVLEDVCDLPDRTDPEDGMMMVTGQELSAILQARLEAFGLSSGALAMLAERRRQVDVEGYTPEHDDAHGRGEMASAAAAYAYVSGLVPHDRRYGVGYAPAWWPWLTGWWKPRDPRRNLIRAGALIIAEIDRLDREAARG